MTSPRRTKDILSGIVIMTEYPLCPQSSVTVQSVGQRPNTLIAQAIANPMPTKNDQRTFERGLRVGS